jgi:hypothetical protein
MSLKKAFIFVAAAAVIVSPFLVWGITGTSMRRNETTAAGGLGNGSGGGCDYSCRSNVVKLLNAYNDYESLDMDNRRKHERGVRNTSLNTKGVLVEEMLQSRINNRPAYPALALEQKPAI